MNWNFLANDYLLRLPMSDQDQGILLEFLSQKDISAHIPRQAIITEPQLEQELRRMAERFQAREAAFWLVENKEDKLVGRISVQHINWLQRSAQMVWELESTLVLAEMQQFFPKLSAFLFNDLGLHRLEMRLRPDFQRHNDLLTGLGFQYEGKLPAQLEFQGETLDLAVWGLIAEQ